MQAKWMGVVLSGMCAAFVQAQRVEAAPLTYSLSVSGTGTATYSVTSDDPSFQARSGSGPATFSADGENVFSFMTNVSISIPGAGIATGASGDPINGSASVTGIGAAGIGPIHIEALNQNIGFGTSSAFGEVTLTPTSVTSRVENGQSVYTIAGGSGTGDTREIDEEFNPDPNGNPQFFRYETDVQLTVSSFTGTVYVSSVPLPASAPMLGGALVVLGAIGLGRRGQKTRAA